MKKSLFLLCLLLGMLGNCALVLAQPAQKLVNVVVSPDRIDWKCKAKEEVKFTVQVFKNENLLKDVVVDYELGPEYFPTVVKKDVRLADGKTTLKAKMNEPGFLRCRVTAKVDGGSMKGWRQLAWMKRGFGRRRSIRKILMLSGPVRSLKPVSSR